VWGVYACRARRDVIRVRLATNEVAPPVPVNNEASKTGREDATLKGLASRKGVSQPERAAVLFLIPFCLSSDSVGAVELWIGSSLGCGLRGPCLIWLEHLLARHIQAYGE